MKRLAGIVTAIAMTVTVAACGSSEPEYVAVCVDPNTEQRLEDEACDNDDDDYLTYAVLWYMLSSSSHPYPAVGSKVNKSYFKTTLPAGSKYTTGLSSKGGTSVKTWTGSKYGGSSSGTSKSGGSSGYKPSTSGRR